MYSESNPSLQNMGRIRRKRSGSRPRTPEPEKVLEK